MLASGDIMNWGQRKEQPREAHEQRKKPPECLERCTEWGGVSGGIRWANWCNAWAHSQEGGCTSFLGPSWAQGSGQTTAGFKKAMQKIPQNTSKANSILYIPGGVTKCQKKKTY